MSKLGAERASSTKSHSELDYQADRVLTARINSRLLSQYKGHTVRLTAKVLKIVGDTATVQASDGGEVSAAMSAYPRYSKRLFHLSGCSMSRSMG